jgi:hypothetical protein
MSQSFTPPVEQSQSWATILAGRIPQFVDVFCLVRIDPATERYTSWGYYLSTSENPGCVLLLAQVRVNLRERTRDGLSRACDEASMELSREIWKNPAPEYVRFRNKLAEDLAYWREANRTPGGTVIERVDDRTFEELVRRAKSAGGS